MEYLKDKSYYEELYDKLTVDDSRLTEQISKECLEKDIKDGVTVPKGYKLESVHSGVDNFMLYFQTGDRYLEKEETIRQWMTEDERKDQLCKRPAPLAYCPKCTQKMALMFKEVRDDFKNDDLRVLCFYKCETCQQKKGIYDNGESYIFENDLCPKCKSILSKTSKKTAKKLTIISNCDKCNISQSYSYDLDEPLLEETKDPDFEKDKARFCLSKEEGEEYRTAKSNLMWLVDSYRDEEEHKAAYEKAKNIKILTVTQISDILSKEFAKRKFGNLTISSPEIGKDIIIGFTVQDMRDDRSEYTSKKDIKKVLNNCLEETNWHVMAEGVDYKLGILKGRLRGQESKEDIYDGLKNS